MKRLQPLILCSIFLTAALEAQTIRRNHIKAYGEGSVTVRPDQAQVSVAIITTAGTAQETASQNAVRATTVLDQLRKMLGANADLKTTSYSLTPNYQYPRDGSPPLIIGFTATNIVAATLADLTIIGAVIDGAIQAGATRIDGLRLSLKDDDPVRAQALRTAGQKARARAEAIAQGLGVKLGAVLAAQEGFTSSPIVVDRTTTVATPTTPVETGQLEVRATVTVEFEILP